VRDVGHSVLNDEVWTVDRGHGGVSSVATATPLLRVLRTDLCAEPLPAVFLRHSVHYHRIDRLAGGDYAWPPPFWTPADTRSGQAEPPGLLRWTTSKLFLVESVPASHRDETMPL